jgi:cholesterol transport system auxiliary component
MESGCIQLNKSYPEKQFYSLDVPRASAQATPAFSKVLRIRRFVVAPQFEGRELVYRTGDLQFESDFYHEWFVSPSAVLTQQTQNWLAASGLFQAIIDSGSRLDEALTLEGYVSALYGDYRDKAAPKAVLEMGVRLIGEDEGRPPILFHQDYRQAITVADESPEALLKGWNEELQVILGLLEEDLRRAKLTTTSETVAPFQRRP